VNRETEFCPLCGSELEWTDCPDCGGWGYLDAWEEDPINFSPGEEYIECGMCHGQTGWWACPNGDQHAKEQPGD